MLPHTPSRDPAAISDQELGFAAVLLLVVMVLAVVFVPGLI